MALSLKTWVLDIEGRKMQKEQAQVRISSYIASNKVAACTSMREGNHTWQHGRACSAPKPFSLQSS